MAERGITFSASMVRALLDGRKTQTRRPIYPQPIGGIYYGRAGGSDYSWRDAAGKVRGHAVDDRLYVQEAWRTSAALDHLSPSAIRAQCLDAGYRRACAPVIYDADEKAVNAEPGELWGRRRWSRHMLREFSRITLTVTDVRVQRIQEISEADARGEGFSRTPVSEGNEVRWQSARDCFAEIWISLHGEEAWEFDQWVFSYTFTVMRANIDADGGGGYS